MAQAVQNIDTTLGKDIYGNPMGVVPAATTAGGNRSIVTNSADLYDQDKTAYWQSKGYDGKIFEKELGFWDSFFNNDLTEEVLAEDDSFLKAAKIVYEAKEGRPWPSSSGNEELTAWTMNHMRAVKNNLMVGGKNALQNSMAEQHVQDAFKYVGDAYDRKSWTGMGLAKAVGWSIADPTNLIGGGLIVKAGLKAVSVSSAKGVFKKAGTFTAKTILPSMALGAGFTTVQSTLVEQGIDFGAGAQKDRINWSRTGTDALTGAIFGGVFSVFGGSGVYIAPKIGIAIRKAAPKVKETAGNLAKPVWSKTQNALNTNANTGNVSATFEGAFSRYWADESGSVKMPSFGSRNKDPATPKTSKKGSWEDKVYLPDLYYVLKHSKHYLGRGLSWKKTYRDYTKSLYAKFDAMKQNSAVNHLININADLAEAKANNAGNFVFKGKDGKPKYDTRGVMNDLGKVLKDGEHGTAASIKRYSDELVNTDVKLQEIANTIKGTENARSVMELLQRQATNTNDVATGTIQNKTYTAEDAISYLDTVQKNIKSFVRTTVEQTPGAKQSEILTKEGGERISELIQEASAKIADLPEGSDQASNVANALQDFASQLNQQSTKIRNQAVDPVLERLHKTVESDSKLLSNSSAGLSDEIGKVKNSSEKLQSNVDRLKENIKAIEADPRDADDHYIGGTTVARLAAQETKPGVVQLNTFSTKLSKQTSAYSSLLDAQQKETAGGFKNLLEALESGNTNLAERRIQELSETLLTQSDAIKSSANPASKETLSGFSNAVSTLDDIEQKAQKYVYNVSAELYGTSHRQKGQFTEKQLNTKLKNRGLYLWSSPTKFALDQDVGVIERELSQLDLDMVKKLTKSGDLKLPDEYDVRYKPGEDTDTRNIDNGKKGNSQKFMEQVWRGVGEEQIGDQAFLEAGQKKIVEHTTGLLQKGQKDNVIEIWKHLATSYSSEVNGSTDRKLGIPKNVFDDFDQKKHSLVQSGQADPIDDETYALLKHMQAAQVELGANNFRRNWRRAWNDTINFRYAVDYKNELGDSSGAEYKGAMAWKYGTRMVKHKLWPLFTPFKGAYDNTIGKRYITPYILEPTKGYRGKYMWGTVAAGEDGARKIGLRTPFITTLSATTGGGVALQLPLIAGGALEGIYELSTGEDTNLDIWGRGTEFQLDWADATLGAAYRSFTDSDDAHIPTRWTGTYAGDRYEVSEAEALEALSAYSVENGKLVPLTSANTVYALNTDPRVGQIAKNLADKDADISDPAVLQQFYDDAMAAGPQASAGNTNAGGTGNANAGGRNTNTGGTGNINAGGGNTNAGGTGNTQPSPYGQLRQRTPNSATSVFNGDPIAAGGKAMSGVLSGAFKHSETGTNIVNALTGGTSAIYNSVFKSNYEGKETLISWLVGGGVAFFGTKILQSIIPGAEKIPFLGTIMFFLLAGYTSQAYGSIQKGTFVGQGNGNHAPAAIASTVSAIPTPDVALRTDANGNPKYDWEKIEAVDPDNNGQYAAQVTFDNANSHVALRMLDANALTDADRAAMDSAAKAAGHYLPADIIKNMGDRENVNDLDHIDKWEGNIEAMGHDMRGGKKVYMVPVADNDNNRPFVFELASP